MTEQDEFDQLRDRIESLEEAVGVEGDDDGYSHQTWYRIDGVAGPHYAPIMSTDIVAARDADPDHEFSGHGIVVYTDEPHDEDEWWETDGQSSSHDTDREYGYWFGDNEHTGVTTISASEVPDR